VDITVLYFPLRHICMIFSSIRDLMIHENKPEIASTKFSLTGDFHTKTVTGSRRLEAK